MSTSITIFATCLIVLLCLGIGVPILYNALGIDYEGSDVSLLQSAVSGSSYSSIALNVIFVLFWTFGLSNWFNLTILLVIRIIGLISLYYIIFPTKS